MWNWITQHAPQLNVLVTGLYTLLTGGVVYLMWRSNRQMRHSVLQTQRAAESRARPYLVFALEAFRPGFYGVRLSNVGNTPAHNIRLVANPEIKPVRGTGSVIQYGWTPDNIGLFQHVITYLPPRDDIRALVGHYSGIREQYPELTFKIEMHYEGLGGPYSESIVLSLKPTDDTHHLEEFEVGDELHKIREALERIERKTKG